MFTVQEAETSKNLLREEEEIYSSKISAQENTVSFSFSGARKKNKFMLF